MNDAELALQVTRRLRTVIDPETGVDVVRMRLVEDLLVDDEDLATYTFRPSSPLCPIAVTLALKVKEAVAMVPGIVRQEIAVEGYIDAEGLSKLLMEA